MGGGGRGDGGVAVDGTECSSGHVVHKYILQLSYSFLAGPPYHLNDDSYPHT